MNHEYLNKNFGKIWPVHVERFTELLIKLRKIFSGDLDKMLILAIIGSRTIPPRTESNFTMDEFQERHAMSIAMPINLQSIADCSGIPRETARRKILELELAGWITYHDTGYLIATTKAKKDLEPATAATLDYLLAIFSTLDEISLKE
jgi:hypothetical protein